MGTLTWHWFGGAVGSTKRRIRRFWQLGLEEALNSDPPSTWMAWMGKGMRARISSRKVEAAHDVAYLRTATTSSGR